LRSCPNVRWWSAPSPDWKSAGGSVFNDEKLALGFKLLHSFRRIPWARANAAALTAILPLHGLTSAIPSDIAIKTLLQIFKESSLDARNLDESRCGLLFVNPALAMDGKFVADIINEMIQLSTTYGFELYITLNIESENFLVAGANLLFDRANRNAVKNAHH
jgi:4-cresol dehydrogenase (hydroxylating) flavoprotein subunit